MPPSPAEEPQATAEATGSRRSGAEARPASAAARRVAPHFVDECSSSSARLTLRETLAASRR
ncbi:MAG TPA: hypothetical protein VGK67_02535 [Myxococcales bacterium]|jgi:hypothetical protein